MLRLLEVQNLALIDNLSFSPGAGLNVITGETGAGKSMLIGAIQLLLGERAGQDVIRDGEESAFIQAVFDDDGLTAGDEVELALPGDNQLILCREIHRGSTNLCRANGRLQPLAVVSATAQKLVDLHGQNQQQSLLNSRTQLQLLDSYGDEILAGLLEEVGALYRERAGLRGKLDYLGGDDAALERKADFIRFQLDEIETAALSEKEEEELRKRFQKLSHARLLAEKTAKLYGELYEGALDAAIVDRLGMVEKELAAAAALDDSLGAVVEQVASAAEQLQQAARELRDYHDGISLDESELLDVSERLESYKKIKKKYGPDVAHVHQLESELRSELSKLTGRSEKAIQIAGEIALLDEKLQHSCAGLSRMRQEAAAELAQQVSNALAGLALQGAQFSVNLRMNSEIGLAGQDSVEFLFSANPGEAPKPLHRVASGGEIARLMLAVKSVLAQQDHVPTLVFDEIDAGIGGVTIRSVAERLCHLAKYRQVICVTHQPLIAAAADHHFVIQKQSDGGRTVTRLVQLTPDLRETELLRMLGGEAGDEAAMEHARQLRKKRGQA
jgi:DNA repair protein RecN (Recombination protein N)